MMHRYSDGGFQSSLSAAIMRQIQYLLSVWSFWVPLTKLGRLFLLWLIRFDLPLLLKLTTNNVKAPQLPQRINPLLRSLGFTFRAPTVIHKFHNQWETCYTASKLATKWNIWMLCVSVQQLCVCLEPISGWLHTNRCIVNSAFPVWPHSAQKTKTCYTSHQPTHTCTGICLRRTHICT